MEMENQELEILDEGCAAEESVMGCCLAGSAVAKIK